MNHAVPRSGRTGGARAAVLERLCADVSAFPDLSLAELDETGLSARDGALAHAIHESVVRNWRALARVLTLHLRRTWEQTEPPVAAALLGGLAQIIYLDRIPVHAAIDESVEWAKGRSGKAAAGLVNAVLRRCADMLESKQSERWEGQPNVLPRGDGAGVLFRRAVLPDDPLEALAIATSHPTGLLRRWRRALGSPDVVRDVALRSLRTAPVILNTAHARGPLPDAEPGASDGDADVLRLIPHERAGSHVAIGSRAALLRLLEQRPDVWVQDPSSSAAVASIADLSPATVLDLCAGQGTKTRQLAALFPEARIVATDVDARRVEAMRRVFGDHPRVRVVEYDQVMGTHQPADLVLLDVPCTNTGVLARRVEAKHRAGPAQLERLTEIQRTILQAAASRLSPAGVILYSTCSLEHEENAGAVEWAGRVLGLGASRVRQDLPQGRIGPDAEAARGYCDGAFSALLARAR